MTKHMNTGYFLSTQRYCAAPSYAQYRELHPSVVCYYLRRNGGLVGFLSIQHEPASKTEIEEALPEHHEPLMREKN
jgi:hypothetical protein